MKKTGAFSATWYRSPDVEIDATSLPLAASDFTRYPHSDVKLVGTAKYILHRDHLGSVRAVTDSAGAKVEFAGYAPYGTPINTAMATRKGYIGERYDAETRLLYLNARYMDPPGAAS